MEEKYLLINAVRFVLCISFIIRIYMAVCTDAYGDYQLSPGQEKKKKQRHEHMQDKLTLNHSYFNQSLVNFMFSLCPSYSSYSPRFSLIACMFQYPFGT